MKKMIWRSAWLALSFALLIPLYGFAKEADSPVRDEMEGISHSMRTLSRQYADASQKASSLELVDTIIKHAQTAKSLMPAKAATLDGNAQTQYLDTFHNDLAALIVELGKLKDAINAGQADVAKDEMNKIAQLKASSHKELGVGGKKRGDQPPTGQAVPPPGQ